MDEDQSNNQNLQQNGHLKQLLNLTTIIDIYCVSVYSFQIFWDRRDSNLACSRVLLLGILALCSNLVTN